MAVPGAGRAPLRDIRVGDCRELLRAMPAESVNCVVTSPPYWGLRDYGLPPQVWGGDPKCTHVWGAQLSSEHRSRRDAGADTKSTCLTPSENRDAVDRSDEAGAFCKACGAWQGSLGLEPTPWLFVEHIVQVFREVRRVLRPDGVLWLNLGDSYATGSYGGSVMGGGAQGARWHGDVDRLRDVKRGYRGDRLANGRGDSPAVLRRKTRATRDGTHSGKHTAIAAMGPMLQPNRMPIPGLKPKDLVCVPWHVAFALQADGWYLRMDVVWEKPNPMPESVRDRPTKAHEYMFLLTKSADYWYDADAVKEPVTGNAHPRGDGVNPKAGPKDGGRDDAGLKTSTRFGRGAGFRVKQNASFSASVTELVYQRNKRSVWRIATQPFGGAHFATFPEKLAEPCILTGCPAGGVVLDPFGGSGTVGQVAEALGRQWILLELNPAYAKLARRRTAQRGLFVGAAK